MPQSILCRLAPSVFAQASPHPTLLLTKDAKGKKGPAFEGLDRKPGLFFLSMPVRFGPAYTAAEPEARWNLQSAKRGVDR